MPLPDHLTLEIVTPERAVVSEQIDEVQIPGAEGSFGVLPGHTPLLATLQVGELWYRRGEETSYVAVSFGFAEVQPDRVTSTSPARRKPNSAPRHGWAHRCSTWTSSVRESPC